jgi:formylglycine-generating enzyme required for sulfatase activity
MKAPLYAALLLVFSPAHAGEGLPDLAKLVRPPRKEPAYAAKRPLYGLAAFGPKADKAVWLVLDKSRPDATRYDVLHADLAGGEKPKEFTNAVGMKMVRIPKGKFTMGSPADEKDRKADEGPQHEVEVSEFFLGAHEVTQAEYEKVMGTNPSYFSAGGGGKDKVKGMDTSRFPVERVSWEEAMEFCKKLNEMADRKKPAGWAYRLPREAEWEYACRGGASSYQTFHFGNSLSSSQANFDGNRPYGGAAKGDFLGRTCKVGSYEKNGFGLFDMHGNVWEWCADWYDPDYYKRSPRLDPAGPSTTPGRVVRGGSWNFNGGHCRSASRDRCTPGLRLNGIGFRVALVPSSRAKVPE